MPHIKEFPHDSQVWRIEGLGAVTRTEHEPVIETHLTSNSLFELTRKPASIAVRKQALIGIGQLPYLKAGSHWRDGRLQNTMTGQRMTLRNVVVRADTLRPVNLGHSLGPLPKPKVGQRWLVPPFKYPFPWDLSRSNCFAIEHEGDEHGIVLPAMEAIRFYYAASTDLAHVMFNGALHLHQRHVIDPALSGPLGNDGKRMVVALRRWLADTDAWIIGRTLGDATAAAGAKRIFDSLAEAGANEHAAFPDCGLPFNGVTDWTARVVDITPPGRTSEQRRWLILSLERCTAAFPFEELEVIRENDARKGDPLKDLPDEEKRPAWSRTKPQADAGDGELQSAEPPSAKVQAVVFEEVGARFAAIEGKKIIKTEKEQCQYKSGQLTLPKDVAAALLGTGEGTHASSAVNPAEIEWRPEAADDKESRARAKALPASFDGLEQVAIVMNQKSGVSASVRSSKGLEFVPKEYPTRKGDWAWLNADGRIRRRVMILDVAAFGRRICVVECELRTNERCATGILISRSNNVISDSELHYALRSHAGARGVWKNTDGGTSLFVDSLKHSQSTYAGRVEVLLSRMRDAKL